jgi:hypothetical protein
MTQEHPITPPPELVQQWWDGTHGALYEFEAVTTQAARWGADQELEACCEWINSFQNKFVHAHDLRLVRRPKPPSLKEQALDDLDGIAAVFRMSYGGDLICDKIRRALEALPE